MALLFERTLLLALLAERGRFTNTSQAKTRPYGRVLAWQEIADAFQTSALAANEDYKLKNLVELFQLSGSLLTSGVVV